MVPKFNGKLHTVNRDGERQQRAMKAQVAHEHIAATSQNPRLSAIVPVVSAQHRIPQQKATVSQPAKNWPLAPSGKPFQRPHPIHKVLQREAAGSRQSHAGEPSRHPIPPPAYLPEQPKIVQPKAALPAPKRPVPPPVYRPAPKRPVQPVSVPGTRSPNVSQGHRIHRPEPKPREIKAPAVRPAMQMKPNYLTAADRATPRHAQPSKQQLAISGSTIQGAFLLSCFGSCFGCCGERPEEQGLLSGNSSGVRYSLDLDQPTYQVTTIKPGQAWPLSGNWIRYDTSIQGKYPVFYKVGYNTIDVVATSRKESKVVAVSHLSFQDKGTHMSFTNFGSDPPFSGLGSIAIELLRGKANGLPTEPSGPIPGSYTFYERMGFKGFRVPDDFKESIRNYLSGNKSEIENAKQHLGKQTSRELLSQIQEGIVDRERRRIGTKLTYVAPF